MIDVKRSEGSLNGVFEALREVILSRQAGEAHEPTATEFFALISTTLASSDRIEHLVEILTVFEAVVPKCAKSIVVSQFQPNSAHLLRSVQKYSDSPRLLRLSLSTLGAMMRLQDAAEGFWSAVHALRTVNCLLGFLDDERAGLRSTVQEQLAHLLATR